MLPAIKFVQAQTALCCMAVVGLTATAAYVLAMGWPAPRAGLRGCRPAGNDTPHDASPSELVALGMAAAAQLDPGEHHQQPAVGGHHRELVRALDG